MTPLFMSIAPTPTAVYFAAVSVVLSGLSTKLTSTQRTLSALMR